jgi:cytochrome bd-type quinol oxidase subunit 2
LGGVSLIGVGALISVASHTTTATNSLNQFFGVISAAVGSVLLVIGIGYLVMFYGLLKGKGWAWTITIILMFIGIAIQIISTTSGTVFNASLLSSSSSNNANTVISGIIGSIIGIAINVAVVYYLYRPNVKAYFGKAHPPEIK